MDAVTVALRIILIRIACAAFVLESGDPPGRG
jgi:hypothetical protein